MTETQPNVIDALEAMMSVEGNPLADALVTLSVLAGGRGTCMCLEHAHLGVTVIADPSWQLDRELTLMKREHLSVVSLVGHEGFDKIAVLVGAPEGNVIAELKRDCAIVAAAIDVVASVAAASASVDRVNRAVAA